MQRWCSFIIFVAIVLVFVFGIGYVAKDTSRTLTVINNESEEAQTPYTWETQTEIVNFAFVDPIIKISKGESVIWLNRDETEHYITFKNESLNSSGPIAKGERFQYVFDETGEYEYYCRAHPYMRGKVIVDNV